MKNDTDWHLWKKYHDHYHGTIPDNFHIEKKIIYIMWPAKNAVYNLTLLIPIVLNCTYQKYHLKDL